MKTFHIPAALSVVLTALACATAASASEGEAAPTTTAERSRSSFHLDLETDPTAFVFSGYSLHAGIGCKHLRLDLGGYAMAVPGFMQSNEGFDTSFRGVGAKLQLFLFDEQKGGFVGIDGGVSQLRAEATDTGLHASHVQVGTGVNFGWRFALPYGLYATPWLGIGYALNAEDMKVDGKTYRSTPVTLFPAVHLGYRFM